MYKYTFTNGASCSLLVLHHDVDAITAAWEDLRSTMIRHIPDAFTRDEWAYLIGFVDAKQLKAILASSFGKRIDSSTSCCRSLFRPRRKASLWLPNNVSLLGPLMVAILSLVGIPIDIKAGSKSEDLTSNFIAFLRDHAAGGELSKWVQTSVTCDTFGRDDPRNLAMAASADVRVIFGSDEAARQIEHLPHPSNSRSFKFINRTSQAWIEPETIDNRLVETLIRIFAIYGRAGCTSPRRVLLLNGSRRAADDFRDIVLRSWSKIVRAPVPAHVASENVLGLQLSMAQGWQGGLAIGNAGSVVTADILAPEIASNLCMQICAASTAEAVAMLPPNAQTVGYSLTDPRDPKWLAVLADSPLHRFVPLDQMHYFGPVWDGHNFFRLLFDEVQIQ